MINHDPNNNFSIKIELLLEEGVREINNQTEIALREIDFHAKKVKKEVHEYILALV